MSLPDELTPDDIRTARYHLLLSTLATGLTVLALYLGSELAGGRPSAPDGRTCTLDTEAERCEEDESCVEGQCQRPPPPLQPLQCQEGDPCGECSCEGNFACDPSTQRCKPLQDDVCTPKVVALLSELRRFEQEKCQGLGGTGAASCAPKDLQNFFMSQPDFDDLLLGLQHSASVLFDKNKPTPDGLPGAQESNYRTEFADLGDRLRRARHIVVIGRASRDKSHYQAANYQLAQTRISVVQRLIAQLAPTPQGQDEMRKKLITLAIGTANPIDPVHLADRPYHTFIAWRTQSSDEVRGWLRELPTLGAAKLDRLRSRLNQSVFVVPVPCEIPEAPATREAQP